MHIIKTHLLDYTHKLLESYLYNRVFAVRFNTTTSDGYYIDAGVPQGSALGSTQFLLYTADIPRCPDRATTQLANQLLVVERWLSNWRIKINEQKCKHITFTLNRQTYPPQWLNSTQIPQVNQVTYLGVHLDRRLTCRSHIERKKIHLKLNARSFHCILNARSPLRLDYKVLLYNSTMKPISTYGSQLWGNASSSNICIIHSAPLKILWTVTGAPCYIFNQNIHRDLGILAIKDEIDKQKGFTMKNSLYTQIV